MKTKNNIQKTVKSQINMMVLRGSAVVISLILISWSVTAQNFWDQFLNNPAYDQTTVPQEEQPSENGNMNSTLEVTKTDVSEKTPSSNLNSVSELNSEVGFEFENEVSKSVIEYNANRFVEDEMSNEIENWKSVNEETDIVASENGIEYKANRFVEDEMSNEIEDWKTGNTVNENLDTENAIKYNANLFVDDEMSGEIENWKNGNIETNNDAVDAESASSIEAGINDIEYSAAKFTDP